MVGLQQQHFRHVCGAAEPERGHGSVGGGQEEAAPTEAGAGQAQGVGGSQRGQTEGQEGEEEAAQPGRIGTVGQIQVRRDTHWLEVIDRKYFFLPSQTRQDRGISRA